MHGVEPFHWYYLWPRGELLIVAVAVIGDAFADVIAAKKLPNIAKYLLGGSCCGLLFLETFLYSQLQAEPTKSSPGSITTVSISLLALTVLVGVICKTSVGVEA